MKLTIPEFSLVVLIGVSGAGKSTFARRNFKSTEILSSDFFRGMVADDENAQNASEAAFAALHYVVARRLEAGRLTVIDATSVEPFARAALVALARKYYCLPVAIVLDMPWKVLVERGRHRTDRSVPHAALKYQFNELARSQAGLQKEGFRRVYLLSLPEEEDLAEIIREPLPPRRGREHGPFDIIGDVHGCFEELVALLERLGYRVACENSRYRVIAPPGRIAVFVGDLVDRGPRITQVLQLVMDMAGAGQALCVPGNHDVRLARKLRGHAVHLTHGLSQTLEQLAAEPPDFSERALQFFESLPNHLVLDEGRLVVAHAGIKQAMQGRDVRDVREFALYGETTGEADEYGLPVRLNWAEKYHGPALVVYGHVPVPQPEWLNRALDIDTGCVYGGKLTALRYPEMEIVSVLAARVYAPSTRPFHPPGTAAESQI